MTATEEQDQRREEQRHLQGHQHGAPSYYGTFQENPNFPQPVHPSQYVPPPGYAYPPGPAYHPIEDYDGPLPCCGLGVGWVLFLLGFLTFSFPWFAGAFIFFCLKHDPREHVGFAACAIAAAMALILGCGRGINVW